MIEGDGTRHANIGGPTLLSATGLSGCALVMSRGASDYTGADGDRFIFSTGTAGNVGWSWGRLSAIGGGDFGNVTANSFTLQGVAQYNNPSYTIPSKKLTLMGFSIEGTSLKLLTNGVVDHSATMGAESVGGPLFFMAAGPSGGGAFLDRVLLAYLWRRSLGVREWASLALNLWQLLPPLDGGFKLPFVEVSFSRPNSDITIANWAGTPSLNRYENIDDITASDVDHNTSPNIDGSQGPAVHGLSQALPVGAINVRLRGLYVGANVGQIRITLLDAAEASVGVGAWQPVTDGYAPYNSVITATAVATKLKIEVQ